jgi:hypothetical protein
MEEAVVELYLKSRHKECRGGGLHADDAGAGALSPAGPAHGRRGDMVCAPHRGQGVASGSGEGVHEPGPGAIVEKLLERD